MEYKSIWMRLGVFVNASKEEIEKVLGGDKAALIKLLKENKFDINGDAYIPDSSVGKYNKENSTDFEEDNIDFELCVERKTVTETAYATGYNKAEQEAIKAFDMYLRNYMQLDKSENK